MKKLFPSYVRVPLIFAIVFGGMEYFIDSGDKPAFIEYPMVSVFLFVFLFLLVAIEIVVSAVDRVTYHLLTDEQRKQLEEAQSLPFTEGAFYKKIMKSVDNMTDLIENVIFIGKSESPESRLHETFVDIITFCEEIKSITQSFKNLIAK
jgi:cytochrome c oxidase cbb3-type subunit 3